MLRPLVLVVVATIAAVAGPGSPTVDPPAVPGDPPPVGYRPPVDAPVSDPFRAPATPYGPGNRGLEYRTQPGAPATAIGVGFVVFAGDVAGRGVVSVVHPDGLRSSLTGLAEVLVSVGAAVDPSVVVGRTTTMLHLGVRRGALYLDPATLFAPLPPRPRHAVLVPVPP